MVDMKQSFYEEKIVTGGPAQDQRERVNLFDPANNRSSKVFTA